MIFVFLKRSGPAKECDSHGRGSHGFARLQTWKYQLNEEHINESSAGNRKKHLPFLQMQRNNDKDSDQLWQTVTAGEQTDVFQTIDHLHAENCCG